MLRKQRRIVPILITGFWLVMVGLFLYREYGGAALPTAPAESRAFVPQDQWMGIYLGGGDRVGHLHMRSDEEARGGVAGYRLQLEAALETTLFGVTAAMDIDGRAWSSTSGDRAEFDLSLRSADTEMGLRGTVAEGRMTGTLDTGGEAIPLDFPVDSKLLLGGGLGLPSENLPALKPGESTTVDAFDPLSMKLAKATLTCTGEETIEISGVPRSARVYETVLGEMTSRAWVGDDGDVLQASTPFGFVLRKIDPSELAGGIVPSLDNDMIQGLAVMPTGVSVGEDPERLVVRIGGVSPEKFPQDLPWQSRDGNVLTLLRPPLPENQSTPDAAFNPEPYLGGDAFVTTTHPAIREKAREIVGAETDSWKRAVLLYDWVYQAIDKVPVLSVPNALDTLRTREGDCNEHTVLYTALARAAEIPTRIAIGLVYSDTLQGFGYHAWPEVHVKGRWHALDPTLGQLRADATHIKLLNGGIETWVQLAGFIGQVDLEVIACE